MFDTIQFDINLLPVSDDERKLLSEKEFQTKSLENALIKYRITEQGCLESLSFSNDFLQHYEPSDEFENWILVEEVHGYISFYTLIRETNEWYEFVAKFTDGTLLEIFRNQGKRYEGNGRDEF